MFELLITKKTLWTVHFSKKNVKTLYVEERFQLSPFKSNRTQTID
jgi:hypothetical protein